MSVSYDAALFAEMMCALRDAGRLPLKPILEAGIERGPALDLGCGPGVLTLAWAQQRTGEMITGLDCSLAMLNEAHIQRERSEKNENTVGRRVSFIEGDAQELPFPDGSFASVFSVNTLHEVPDPARMLSEIHRVLRPGGAYCVRDLHRGGDWTTLAFADDLPGIEHFRPMVRSCLSTAFAAETFMDLVRQSPLADGSVTVNPMLLALVGRKAL